MPQPKRRKLSQVGEARKESERSRNASGTANEGSSLSKKSKLDDAGTNGEGPTAQAEKRAQSEAKPESSTSSAATTSDGKDNSVSTTAAEVQQGRVSFSGRIIKQTRKGRCFAAAIEAAQNKQLTSASQGASNSAGSNQAAPPAQPKVPAAKSTTPVRKQKPRKRRSWDVWSQFEQAAFFEGLFEHGKDFDAIHNLVTLRSRKRAIDPVFIKTKEQVRYMYYRMWNKISKHVNMGEDVKKETQELYGLVNYYAMRKIFNNKYYAKDERFKEHLNELIHTGVTKLRDPNPAGKKNKKKLRIIRTPVCNALKKLNNLEPEVKVDFLTKLPQHVTVELTPRSSAAWLRVHNSSQNPRVRLQTSVNRSLGGIVDYLQKKWRGHSEKLREELGSREEGEELVLYPHHSFRLQPVSLAAQRATSVNLINFASYRNNILAHLSSPPAGAQQGGGRSAKKPSSDDQRPNKAAAEEARDAGEGNNEEKPPSDGPSLSAEGGTRPIKSRAKTSLLPRLYESVIQSAAVSSNLPCEDENAMFPDAPFSSSPLKEEGENQGDENSRTLTVHHCDNAEQKTGHPSPDAAPHSKEEEERKLIERIKSGVTRQLGHMITLAKLSLMLGKPEHVRLEYEWRPKGFCGSKGRGVVGDAERLSNMLRRLSGLSTLEYREIVQRGKVAIGGRMSQCTLCGQSLERPARTSRKTVNDVATETDPLTTDMLGGAMLNSNGTLVGLSCKTNFIRSTKDLTPDRDGVFRVPMPMPVSMAMRGGSPQKSGGLTPVCPVKPLEPVAPVITQPNYLLPKRRRHMRKPPNPQQRTLLPKPHPHSPSLLLVPGIQGVLMPASLDDALTAESVQQQSELSLADSQSSLEAMLHSQTELEAKEPVVSHASLLGENSASEDFASHHLDMPMIVSPTHTAAALSEKRTQQLIQHSVSPSSLSSMLDISLPPPASNAPDSGDRFLDLVNANSGFSDLLKSPMKEGLEKERVTVSYMSLDTPHHALSVIPSSEAVTVHSSSLNTPQHTPISEGVTVHYASLNTPQHTPSNEPVCYASLNTPQHTPISEGVTVHYASLNTPQHTPNNEGFTVRYASLNTPQHTPCSEVGYASLHTPQHSLSTPPSSPLYSTDKAEPQWLTQPPPLSLSSFLPSPVKRDNPVGLDAELSLSGLLASPVKKPEGSGGLGLPMISLASAVSSSSSASSFIPAPPALFGEGSQDSMVARLDMDTALQSVMLESSVDYSSKFEKLAAHLADTADTSQSNL